jgi:TolB-like protein/DNA-binding winged helix-turn-helix (wHTH) protein/Tfp pilus assembly protein PilF
MADDNTFEFGDFELDGGQRKLSQNGEAIPVEPKAFDLLVYLASHHHRAVDKDELQNTLWPGVILTESALTRCVMKARRAVGDSRELQQVIRTVHGHGYQFVADLTPSAPAPAETPVAQAPAHPSRMQGWLVAAGLGALAVLTIVALLRLIDRPGAAPSDRSIAVLPFVDRSNDQENAKFLADGIHDDLLTLLSKLGDLRVISRTSMEQYRDTAKTIPQIAEELGVSTVVEGGVQLSGNRVRINAQLIDASNDEHLWAETFERQLSAEQIFEIQAEIAHAIADALQAKLSPIEKQVLATTPTRNLDALYAYQRGQLAFDQTTGQSLEEAKAYFEQALQHDPKFAAAMVGLAYTYIYLPTFGSFSSAEGYRRAGYLIADAIGLNPTLGEAYGARAILESRRGDLAGSTESLKKAMSLAPNSSLILITYAMTLNRSGRGAEALPAAKKAMRIDPVLPLPYLVYGDSLESMGRIEEALEQYERTIEIDPESPRGYASVGDKHIELGDFVEGVRFTRLALTRGPEEAWLFSRLGRVYSDLGDLETADAYARRSLELSPGAGLSLMTAAYVALRRGNDAVAQDFAKSLRGRLKDEGLNVLRVLSLRNDPASVEAVYRQNHPEWFDATAPTVGATDYRAAIRTAGVMLRVGLDAKANELLQVTWTATRNLPLLGQYGRGIADAEMLALMGKQDEALDALETAVHAGWRMRWWLHTEYNPNLDSIRDTERYQAVISTIESDMNKQLLEIGSLERRGEIDPLPKIPAKN